METTATEKAPLVGIIMGSKSDLPVMEGCTAELERLGVPYELVIASAHRNPAQELRQFLVQFRHAENNPVNLRKRLQ